MLLRNNLLKILLIIQFSSAQSCLTLCDPMDFSMPVFHAHHQLPELAQEEYVDCDVLHSPSLEAHSTTNTLIKSTILHINIDKSLQCYADLKEPDTKEHRERATKMLQEL